MTTAPSGAKAAVHLPAVRAARSRRLRPLPPARCREAPTTVGLITAAATRASTQRPRSLDHRKASMSARTRSSDLSTAGLLRCSTRPARHHPRRTGGRRRLDRRRRSGQGQGGALAVDPVRHPTSPATALLSRPAPIRWSSVPGSPRCNPSASPPRSSLVGQRDSGAVGCLAASWALW